jgi:hypothetical protein
MQRIRLPGNSVARSVCHARAVAFADDGPGPRWVRSPRADSGAGGRTECRHGHPAFFGTVPWDLVLKAVIHLSHRTGGGFCCMWSGGSKRRCHGRPAPWWPGIAGPRQGSTIPVDRRPVHALRVRRLNGPGVPGGPVRALPARTWTASCPGTPAPATPHLGTAAAIARINPRRTRPHRRGCEPATPAISMPLHMTSEYLRGFRYRPRGGSEVGR